MTRDVTQHLLNAKIVPFVSSQTRIHSQDGLTDFTDFLSSPPSPFSVYDTQACSSSKKWCLAREAHVELEVQRL